MTDRSKRLFVYQTIFALGAVVGTAWAAQVNLFPATQVDSAQRAKVVEAVIANHTTPEDGADGWTNAQKWTFYGNWLKAQCRAELRAYYHRLAVEAAAGQLNADFVAEETPDLNTPEP